jgi:hypothetical protein
MACEELTVREAMSRQWGYHPLMFVVTTEDGLVTDRCRIYGDLVFVNSRTNKRLEGQEIVTTVRKARAEGKRLRCGADYGLMKHYQFHFTFRNENPLPISNVRVRIALVDKEGRLLPRSAFDNARYMVSEFVGKREFGASFDVYCRLEDELPDEMWFRMVIDYHLRGKGQPSKAISVRYKPQWNDWSTGM